MPEASANRWGYLVAGATLGTLVLVGGYLAIARAVAGLAYDENRRAMDQAAGAAAVEAEQRLGGVVEALRDRANELAQHAALGAESSTPSWRVSTEPIVRASLSLGADGEVLGSVPRDWPGAGAVAHDPGVGRTIRGGVLFVGLSTAVSARAPMLLMAMAVAPTAPAVHARTAALVAVLDLGALQATILTPHLQRQGDWAALFAGDAPSPLIVAGEAPPNAADADYMLGSRLADQGARLLLGGRPYVTSRRTPLSIGGQRWTVVLFRPREAALADASRIMLASGFFALVALALGGAAVLGFRRQGRVATILGKDAERWREIAAEVEREERWRIIAEEAREPIVFLRGTRVAGANFAAVAALGARERSDVLGVDFLRYVDEEERPRLERRLARVSEAGGLGESFRTTLLGTDGERRVAEVATSSVPGAGSHMIRLSWEDLTSRERAEALLRAVAASVPVGVAVLDQAGRLTWANPAVSNIVHVSLDRFVGRVPLALVDERDHRRARSLVARATRGRPTSAFLRLRTGLGDVVPMVVRAVPVTVAREVDGVILVGCEGATSSALDGWSQLPDAALLGQLAGRMAHRINNDLQALVGVVERIGSARPADRGHDDLHRLAELVTHGLRQLAALSRGGSRTSRRESLGALAERWRQSAATHVPDGVRLVIRREASDDAVELDGVQLLLLLDLALAAAAPGLSGGGVFEVAVLSAPRPDCVRLSIFDSGSVEKLAGLGGAEEFAPSAPSREMVRAVARVVARSHGGEIAEKSTVGLGHRLWCDFPRTEAGVPDLPESARSTAGTILVADDEEMVRAALATALREFGYTVDEAGNGREAVDRVAADPDRYALVILDLVMPVMDGREALRHLREVSPGLPVLVCTGYDPVDDPLLATAMIAVKPLTADELAARVAALVPKRRDDRSGDGTMNA
jgi:PAS domain S-box-containing protein